MKTTAQLLDDLTAQVAELTRMNKALGRRMKRMLKGIESSAKTYATEEPTSGVVCVCKPWVRCAK